MKKKLLFFLQLGRSGGTTLKYIIMQQYPPEAFYNYSGKSAKKIFQIRGEKKEKLRVLMGHFPFGLHRIFKSKAEYFTLMRNPIEMIVSSYYYIKNKQQHNLHKIVEGMSFDEFINSDLTVVNNNSVRYLLGLPTNHTKFQKLSKRAMAIAKKNLDKFFPIVGTSERFDNVLILLKKRYGWKNIFYLKARVNLLKPKNFKLSNSQIRLIKEKNAIDFEIYKYINQRLDSLRRKGGLYFLYELAIFKTINFMYQGINIVIFLLRYRSLSLIPKPIKNFIKKSLVIIKNILSFW